MVNVLLSSSLNYLFYINRIKRFHLAIAIGLINIGMMFFSFLHAVWLGAVFWNGGFYISPSETVNYGQLVYSIFITLIVDSTLTIMLCLLIKSRMKLLFIDLAIVILILLLGAMLMDNFKISDSEAYFYIVLICPQNYLTAMNEMALSANTHYYTGMLPNLNGSFFYP
jgi:hypothetical protein